MLANSITFKKKKNPSDPSPHFFIFHKIKMLNKFYNMAKLSLEKHCFHLLGKNKTEKPRHHPILPLKN